MEVLYVGGFFFCIVWMCWINLHFNMGLDLVQFYSISTYMDNWWWRAGGQNNRYAWTNDAVWHRNTATNTPFIDLYLIVSVCIVVWGVSSHFVFVL